jgi:hypothetical protein
MAAQPADRQSTSNEPAEAGRERQKGGRAKSRATRAEKPRRAAPPAPAAEAAAGEAAAAAAPTPAAKAVAALAEPAAAAVQASQALAAAPATPPRMAVAPRPWPVGRAGQAVLESGLRLQQETVAFALAQAARNWKAGQELARCSSLPQALAVQRELLEQTVAHGSSCLGTLSRLTAEAVRAALRPLDRG